MPLYNVKIYFESETDMDIKDFKNFIFLITEKQVLNYEEAKSCFEFIMSGQASDILISSFLTSLKINLIVNGFSSQIIAAGADIMREKAISIKVPENAIDVVGTGGDGHNTFNISTATAFVVAGTGVPVAKHGNYSASSKSGAANVLESLGVNIQNKVENIEDCLKECGICFFFAPKHHSAMKFVMNVRKELGFRTIFNLLGPLSNPGFVKKQIVGVYSKELLIPFVKALKTLGSTHSWVVCGSDGLDEVSTTGPTYCAELKKGEIRQFEIRPEIIDIPNTSLQKLTGGTPEENAKAIIDLFNGKKGPFTDIVTLNAASALMGTGNANNLYEAKEKAIQSINNGNALEKLNNLIKKSNS